MHINFEHIRHACSLPADVMHRLLNLMQRDTEANNMRTNKVYKEKKKDAVTQAAYYKCNVLLLTKHRMHLELG